MVKILPSILAADFSRLAEQISAVEAAGADMHHVDIMDGHFVPNISFGSVVVDAIARVARKPLDIHLMVSNPQTYVNVFSKVKPAVLTIHAEATNDIRGLLQTIRQTGSKAGLSIKPQTPFADIVPFLPDVDVLLVMSVEPGFGGQAFMPEVISKIREATTYIKEHDYPTIIEVDGGINKENASVVTDAGATWLVAGSSVYTADQQFSQNIASLRAGGTQ